MQEPRSFSLQNPQYWNGFSAGPGHVVKEKSPPRATAASLFKAASGRTMTNEEKSRISNYKDDWRFRSK
jgi:hypothetical protein